MTPDGREDARWQVAEIKMATIGSMRRANTASLSSMSKPTDRITQAERGRTPTIVEYERLPDLFCQKAAMRLMWRYRTTTKKPASVLTLASPCWRGECRVRQLEKAIQRGHLSFRRSGPCEPRWEPCAPLQEAWISPWNDTPFVHAISKIAWAEGFDPQLLKSKITTFPST